MTRNIESLIENEELFQSKNKRTKMRDVIDRICNIEQKANRYEDMLNDMIGNIIQYRTELSMMRTRIKSLEKMVREKGDGTHD